VKLGSIDIAQSVHETHSFIQAVSTPFPVLRVPARARWLTLPSPVLGNVCVLTCTKVEVVGEDEDGKTGRQSSARWDVGFPIGPLVHPSHIQTTNRKLVF
jgi:hypothetical protein